MRLADKTKMINRELNVRKGVSDSLVELIEDELFPRASGSVRDYVRSSRFRWDHSEKRV